MAPTVKTFCGCCNLRTACIIIAGLELIGSIIYILETIVVVIVIGDADEFEDGDPTTTEDYNIIRVLAIILMIILIPLSVINILFCYWFIRGATSVRKIT